MPNDQHTRAEWRRKVAQLSAQYWRERAWLESLERGLAAWLANVNLEARRKLGARDSLQAPPRSQR